MVSSRILSIQSHVVRGNVGNRAAVFPLQLLQHDVDFINSVDYTSMYIHEGTKVTQDEIRVLLETLPLAQKKPAPEDHPGPLRGELDRSLSIDHKFILTGYAGSAEFLREVTRFIKRQRSLGATFQYVCDPVIGDNGKPYVDSAIIEIYKSECVPLADVLTPNQYELAWLTESKPIATVEDAVRCCRTLHAQGPKYVVVTSIAIEGQDNLILLGSEKTNEGQVAVFEISIPKQKVYLGGTGDLMAAMLVDGLDRFGGDLKRTCSRAIAILQAVIHYTMNNSPDAVDIDVVGAAHVISNQTNKEKIKHNFFSFLACCL